MLKNMKIGMRLGLGFAVILVLMITMIIISFMSMKNTHELFGRIVNVNNVRIKASYEIIDDARETSIEVRNIILSRGRKDADDLIAKAKSSLNVQRKEYVESLARLEELTPKDNTRAVELISKVKASGNESEKLQDKVVSLAESGRFEDANNFMHSDAYPSVKEWISNLQNLIKFNEERNALRYEQIMDSQNSARIFMIIVAAIALFVGVFLSVVLTLGITRPIAAVMSVTDRMAAGDLTVDIITEGRLDEPGILMEAVKKMSMNLREQTKGILDAVNVIASSTSQASATSKQLATSAQETLASVSETTATMEEVRQTSRLVNQKAALVSDISQNAAHVSESGSRSAEEFFSIMGRIREQMDFIANSIVKLSEQSQTIGLIISSVNDLASQSNLLAVNASIEASKAGEHGKGFAVVAQEVRSLAEQSRDATNQVRTILSDVQKSIGGAVMATEQGKNAVDAGVKQSHEAREAIRLMAEGITNSSQASTQIMVSINEQTIGIDQVAMAMESIKKATEQIVESTRQSEGLSRDLSDLGRSMKEMTGKFRV